MHVHLRQTQVYQSHPLPDWYLNPRMENEGESPANTELQTTTGREPHRDSLTPPAGRALDSSGPVARTYSSGQGILALAFHRQCQGHIFALSFLFARGLIMKPFNIPTSLCLQNFLLQHTAPIFISITT